MILKGELLEIDEDNKVPPPLKAIKREIPGPGQIPGTSGAGDKISGSGVTGKDLGDGSQVGGLRTTRARIMQILLAGLAGERTIGCGRGRCCAGTRPRTWH